MPPTKAKGYIGAYLCDDCNGLVSRKNTVIRIVQYRSIDMRATYGQRTTGHFCVTCGQIRLQDLKREHQREMPSTLPVKVRKARQRLIEEEWKARQPPTDPDPDGTFDQRRKENKKRRTANERPDTPRKFQRLYYDKNDLR